MDKKPLVLIHGALGSANELKELAELLSQDYSIHNYEIPGHGNRADELAAFSMEKICLDFSNFLEKIGPSFIFGFSLGGYLALTVAQKSEKNILGIVTLGTKFDWSPETAKKETKGLNISFLKSKVPDFYEYLTTLHREHLPDLLTATASFMLELGNSPAINEATVKKISIPVRIIRGGKDKMVSKEESVQIANAIKQGLYFEIPHFIHPIGYLNKKRVAHMLSVQLASFDYKFLALDDFTIAHHSIEKNSEYRFIFLHEALGSIAQWKNFPKKLCDKLNISGTIIEMKGYGFSSENKAKRGADYLHRFALEDLPTILNKLDFKENLILVGHSDGGTNALLFGAKHPDKTVALVTMAAHILNEPETKNGIPPAIKAYEEGKLKGLEVFHGEKTEKLFFDWAHTWLNDFFSDWNITRDIQNISIPGLIIQGKDDQYGTDEQVHKIADCFDAKVEKLFLKECGHAPHLEKQEEILNKIYNWLQKEVIS